MAESFFIKQIIVFLWFSGLRFTKVETQPSWFSVDNFLLKNSVLDLGEYQL